MSSPGIPESLRRDSTTGPSVGVTIAGGEVSVDTTGLATDANQDTIIGHVDGIETLLTSIDSAVNGTIETTLDGGYIDSFGHLVVGSVNNQIDIQYYRNTPQNLVTVTTATGGTATATGGMATYATSTSAASASKGVTNESTVYTGGAEVYTIFTAAFPVAGSGTSFQRIGLYDDNNGFFVGYEGATFGATVRKGASDVQTPKASFSIDTLVGGAGSQFTRNGTPEAIDLTKLNVFRIRYGWVGSAPIKFEVLSPDGEFVNFHTIKQPNLAVFPSIEDSDLPFTCNVITGNSGTALSILTNCWVAGTTQALTQMDSVLTDKTYAQLTRSVITGESSAGGGSYVNLKVNPSGTLSADVSGTVAVTGVSTLAEQQTQTASLSVLDDWDNAASDGASVSGDVAHDSADAGEPVKIGGKALTAPATAVTANDRVNAMFDVYGRQVGIAALREMKGSQITTITASTSETTIVTADATYKLDLYGIIVVNTSATATEIAVKDSTAGTTRFQISIPANDMRGFMLPMDAGHLQAAVNNNWTATAADSVSSLVITAFFVKNL